MFSQQLNKLGVLLGKSDQIKRTRAPFYSLCLNLELARLIAPNKRYVGNGSTIARGGTLTHLTFGPLGQTVQQGDAYRSIVNEYNEFKLRVDSVPNAPSFFEIISIFVGPAEKANLAEYQDLIANELCDGVLDNYPTEASRSHFKYKTTAAKYSEIMAIKDLTLRKNELKQHIIPHLRAIPETNIALSKNIYPIEQDLKVAHLYHLLKTSHLKALLSFYRCKSDTLPTVFTQPLTDALIKHRDELNDNHSIILAELSGHFIPPALSFCIAMIQDTLRHIDQNAPIRQSYINLLRLLSPSASVPEYLPISDNFDDSLSFQAI